MKQHTIADLHKKYIRGTAKDAVVQNVQSLLCNLTQAVREGLDILTSRVYINTRVLKHVYDKRPAEEFDFLIEHVHMVIKFPEHIYKNKNGKKGHLCFVAQLQQQIYFCSLEIVSDKENNYTHYEIVTFFRLYKKQYLDNYELLWEWKGGTPSS